MDHHGPCNIFSISDKNSGWKLLQSKKGCDLKQDCSRSVCYSEGKYQLRFCLPWCFLERMLQEQVDSLVETIKRAGWDDERFWIYIADPGEGISGG
jgi:hypothetical protein